MVRPFTDMQRRYWLIWTTLSNTEAYTSGLIANFTKDSADYSVTCPPDSAIRRTVEPIYEAYGIPMSIVCESNNLSLSTPAVESGMGYAFMPSMYLNTRPELYKYAVEVNAPQEYRQNYFGFTYLKSILDNCSTKNFRDLAMGYFSELQKQVHYTPTDEMGDIMK